MAAAAQAAIAATTTQAAIAAIAATAPRPLRRLIASAARRYAGFASTAAGAVALALVAAAGVAAALAATAAGARALPSARFAIGDGHDAGWDVIAAQPRRRRIAYAGSNLPLPLWGARLANEVHYVNVFRGAGAALHDFRDLVGSRDVSGAASAEPAPYRAAPDVRQWLANLDALDIDLLFVTTLYPVVRTEVAHDRDGFPIERAWADARPERFSLLFATDDVRVYDRRSSPR